MVPTKWDTVKNVLISTAIGFLISVLTILFQYFIDWLQAFPPEYVGASAGMLSYITKWRSNLLG